MVTSEQVAGVRRFNRTVPQRAGVLGERFAGEDRPLDQSRRLYEVGRQVSSLLDRRLRLGLVAGDLSRLIDGLASRGLVALAPDEGGPRVRWAALTEKGFSALEEIDARSGEIAPELLEALDERQRDRLVQAGHTVVRLLRIAELRLEVFDPSLSGPWTVGPWPAAP